ncbi:HET-domain-containing protein [Parathielavia appendiculata]|uniref:HET-domain-containing protein n=1 Tax=Parathielavia appendiculata TaxID=2587402 RepID=A0AAN6TSD5_9PEZI|nr:HET-domain-containing protein [Parathielavia appendiculata]
MPVFNKARKAWKKVEEWANDDDGRPEPALQTEATLEAESQTESQTESQANSSAEPPPRVPFCYINNNKAIASSYTYVPLSANIKRPIRLLTLLPGPRDADIQCLLTDADLDGVGREEDAGFEALSYVWGDMSNTTPIQIGNAISDIGQNLRSALLHLRYEDRPRTLWVDAVCINQDDIDERSSQVALMGDIYTKATRVVVWLGCPCCLLGTVGPDLSSYRREELKEQVVKVERLFIAIKLLGREAAVVAKEGRQVIPKKGDQYEDGTSYELIRKLDPDWAMVFLDNPWWTRVWTLQEIVLAHDAIMCMGSEEVGWDFLRSATAHYMALGFAAFSGFWFGNKTNSRLEPLNMVISIKEMRQSEAVVGGDVGDELLYYLASSHWRDSKMPHDKIYAVLGFFDKDRHVGIDVDYRFAPANVYHRATRALMERSGNLDVLGFCYPFKVRRVTDLPSWVPDWGSTGNLAAPLMNDAKGKLRTTHASKGSRSNPRWEDDNMTLIVQGHIVDSITKVGSVKPAVFTDDLIEGSADHLLKDPAVLAAAESFPATWDDLDPERPIRHLLSEYWKNFKAAAPLAKKLLSEVIGVVSHKECYIEWQDLIASELKGHPDPNVVFRDILTTSTPYPSGQAETQRRFEQWLKALSSVRRLKGVKLDRISPAMFKTLGFAAGLWKAMEEDEDSFSTYTLHTVRRRLGITQSGRVCLVPKRAEVGDDIALLRGGRVPVVLRPRAGGRGHMELIGEAFVYGIMDGEAFDEAQCVEFKIV